jgi:hypothetical protein
MTFVSRTATQTKNGFQVLNSDPTFPSKAAKLQSHNTPMEAQGGK